MDRNWSAARVVEPVWRHQRVPARQDPLTALDALATRIRYRRDQQVYEEDSTVEYWYRVISGLARRFTTRADGKRQIVDLLLPGDVFGFGARGKHTFAVEAVLDDTVVARYPRSRLENAARLDPDIARQLREAACQAISRLHALILNLGRTTAEQKVGHFLVKMAERLSGGPADSVVLPMSREDIADYLALSVETVSRSLTQLKLRGAIRLTGVRQISILDRTALADGYEEELSVCERQHAGVPPSPGLRWSRVSSDLV
jgi:CRP/FNR family transcriptional regulator, nitrogen fixation regulation protein